MSSRDQPEDQLRISKQAFQIRDLLAELLSSSSSICSRSRAARRASRMSRIAWAWISENSYCFIRLLRAVSVEFGRADRGDDLIDDVERLLETLENVGAATRPIEFELGSARDHDLPVSDVLLQRASKGQDARMHAVLDQSQHVDAERLLQGRVLEEVVQHLHRLRVALQLDDHAHAGPVGLVAKVADPVESCRP